MLITTQAQFDTIMVDPLTDISTTIEFPGGTVDWQLNITKSCTIFGNNTTIDLSDLGIDTAITVSAAIDISDLTVINTGKTAISMNGVSGARFEKIRAGYSNIGWMIKDSFNNEFEECEAYNCGTGIELQGSSTVIGDIDSYQELSFKRRSQDNGQFEPILINGEDFSGISANQDYYFKVSGKEYKLTSSSYLSYNNLVQYMNNAKRVSDGQVLKADFIATLTGGHIRISSLTSATVNIERGTIGNDLFNSLIGFDSKGNTSILFNADINLLQSKYFFFSYGINDYYVWYNVNDSGIDPEINNRQGIEIALLEDDTATNVAQKTYQKLIDIRPDITINNDTITIDLQSLTVSRPPTQKIITFQDVLNYNQQSDFFEFSSLNNDYYAWYAIKQNSLQSDPAPIDPKTIIESAGFKYPELQNKIGIRVDLEVPNFASFSYTDGDARTPTPDFIKSLNYTSPDYLNIISNLKLSVTDKFYLELKKIQDPTLLFDIYGNKLIIITTADTMIHPIEDFNTGFVFYTTPGALDGMFETAGIKELEENRLDRCHNNIFNSCLIHNNSIGIKLINANHNQFMNCKTYENMNIGLWQLDVSYDNIYRGEIFQNIKYGIRNTDKNHLLDASSVWWGDVTGPSGGGRGEGDKVSSYVIIEPWLQSGTEPELAYPVTRNFIWNMLGYPQVAVEMTEDQIGECINVALEKYHYYWQPEPYYYYLDVGVGQRELELPPDITKDNIIEVSYSPNNDIFSQLSGSGESFFLTYYMQKSGGTFLSDFYVAMAYKETFERTLGIQPSYEFVVHPDVNGIMKDFIRLYPSPSSHSIKVALKVSRTLSEKEVDQDMWIRKYALAWAKQMLGQIRSKFASVPGPTGEVSIKGDALIQEGKDEEEKLVLDLIKRSEPLGFICG